MSALTTNVGGYLFTVSDSGLTQINANDSVYIPIGITSGVRESDDLGSIPEPEIPVFNWPVPSGGCGLCVVGTPTVTPTPAPVPEPGTMALLAVALVAGLVWRRA